MEIKYDYRLVSSFDEILDLQQILNEKPSWVYDIETTTLDTFKAQTTGIGFTWEKYQAIYVPLLEYKPIIGLQEIWGVKQKEAISILKAILENDSVKGAQNGKFDNRILMHEFGIHVSNYAIDTMLMLSVLFPGRKSYSLGTEAEKYPDLAGYKEATKGADFARLSLKELAYRNNRDTDLTWRLIEDYYPLLSDDEKLSNLFNTLTMPSSDLTMGIEYKGYRIDTEYAYKFHIDIYNELIKIREEIKQATGVILNVRSSEQIADLLFNKLKLPVIERTDGGAPATGKVVLKELLARTQNPMLEKVMRYRSLAANKGTFVDSFVPVIKRKDNKDKGYLLDKNGYYHGNFKLWRAATGRLASGKEEGMDDENSLNLQNIPRDVRFRREFLPDPGQLMLGADEKQIELRILAHLCQDRLLLQACKDDYDLHTFVGSMMAGVEYEFALTGYKGGDPFFKKIRDSSKNVGFGWIYGAKDGKFSYAFPGKTESEKIENEIKAKKLYFERFGRIMPWKNALLREAKEKGFIYTMSGRKIYCPEINSPNGGVRSHAERQLVNAAIQGPASDLVLASGLELNNWFVENQLPARILNFVHDAIYSSSDKVIVKDVYYKTIEIMSKPRFGCTTKLGIDIKIWDRWEGENRTKEYIN